MTPGRLSRRRWLLAVGTVPAFTFAGCAGLAGLQPLRVNMVGLTNLPSEGLEIRLAVKLRVQNPNTTAVEFDGISMELDVNGRALASGVSAERGTIPRFGDTVLTVPVSVSAVAAVRQMLGLMDGGAPGELPYKLHGRLGGGLLGSLQFSSEGLLKLPR